MRTETLLKQLIEIEKQKVEQFELLRRIQEELVKIEEAIRDSHK